MGLLKKIANKLSGQPMTRITILPHEELCPKGAVIDAEIGKSLCRNLLDNAVEIDHACEMSCACTTCHVVIREGFNGLVPADEAEEDMLDRAWGLEPTSRLACQTIVTETPLVIEIPRYTLNMAKEGPHK